MALLQHKDRQYITSEFAKTITRPVKLVVFTQSIECEYCRETRQIAEEIAELSPHVSSEVYDFVEHKEVAAQYGVTQIPATVVLLDGEMPKDFGIRYYGIPAGYEFTSLVQDIIMVGSGETDLSAETKQWAASLTKPIHLQVFVTPTCPFCPPAVRLAHKLAMESDLIQADMVEATEFPHLAVKYNVMGVPRTVINETTFVEGAVPEVRLLNMLKQVSAN
jgi:glutaredoxin-like protein